MGIVLLSELINKTELELQALNYKESVLQRYRIEFRSIAMYFASRGQVDLSRSVLDDYLRKASGDYAGKRISRTKHCRIFAACDRLLQYYEHGSLSRIRRPNLKAGGHLYVGDDRLICGYSEHLCRNGISPKTRQNYLRVAILFMAYAMGKSRTLQMLSQKDVSGFLLYVTQWYTSRSMSVVMTALRSFFSFAREHHYCEWDMSLALPRQVAPRTIVQQPLTQEEEGLLLQSIDRATPVGKRDFALIVLIMRTGLRTVDVMNLMLNDIDWRRNEIRTIQQKTQRPLILPLLPEVGNAIADYLLEGRPTSTAPYVFLRSCAPYTGLRNAYSCSLIVQRRMKDARIRQQKGNRNGGHSLRHSLAYRLLQEATPLTVISSILGHRNKDSTERYLSTDLEHLRACSLTLDGIEVGRGSLL